MDPNKVRDERGEVTNDATEIQNHESTMNSYMQTNITKQKQHHKYTEQTGSWGCGGGETGEED